MGYEIKSLDDKLCIEFNGVLKALDLIFVNQSPDYKSGLIQAHKLMMDFSRVTGSELTETDIHGLLMLGKLDSEKVPDIQLFIVTDLTNNEIIQQMCNRVFAPTSWQVRVFASRQQADTLFNS